MLFDIEIGETNKITISHEMAKRIAEMIEPNKEKKEWFIEEAEYAKRHPDVINKKNIENNFAWAINEPIFSALLGGTLKLGAYLKTVKKSMIGLYTNKKGLCWIDYPKGTSIKLHLRKGMYTNVDENKRVVYSKIMEGLDTEQCDEKQLRNRTYGEYPEFTFDIQNSNDAKYALNLIKNALLLD